MAKQVENPNIVSKDELQAKEAKFLNFGFEKDFIACVKDSRGTTRFLKRQDNKYHKVDSQKGMIL